MTTYIAICLKTKMNIFGDKVELKTNNQKKIMKDISNKEERNKKEKRYSFPSAFPASHAPGQYLSAALVDN